MALYTYSRNTPVRLSDPDGNAAPALLLLIGVGGGETAGAAATSTVAIWGSRILGGLLGTWIANEAADSPSADSPGGVEAKGQTKPEVGTCPTCGSDTSNKTGKIAKDHGLTTKETKDRIHDLKGDAKITGNPDVEVCKSCGEVFPQTPDGGLGDSIGNINEDF